MFCTNCGKKVYDGDKFCANCGSRVRAEAPAVKPVSQDIVFNPPFKVEAEKRTNEIYRGFASDTPAAEEKPRRTEPVSFDWNLSGFPQETRKTEEVDFNWGSVIERRNQQRRNDDAEKPTPVVDKIEIRHGEKAPVQEEPAKVEDEAILAALMDNSRVRKPLFDGPLVTPAAAAAEMFAEPSWEPINVAMEKAAAEPKVREIPSAEEVLAAVREESLPLEVELIRTVEGMELTDEIPELILPEEEEEKTIPEMVAEETAAAEETDTDAQEEAMSIEELEAELFGKDYKGIGMMAPEESVKSTAQLEKFYTYNKKNEEFQQLLDQEYERLQGMESARRADTESLEFTWATSLFPERKDDKKEEPAPIEETAATEPEEPVKTAPAVDVDATIDFSAVREEARMKKMQAAEAEVSAESVPAEEPAAESKAEPAEPAAEAPAEEAESAEPEEETAETETVDETAEATVEEELEEEAVPSEEPSEKEHDEKAKLRYSDIFPREGAADDRNGSGAAVTGTAAKVSEVFDEYDEDEPKKMNFFFRLIITLLVLLILAEGVILLAKLIAPDSVFTQKADILVESILDRITGGDGTVDDDEDPSLQVSGNEKETTYITEILTEKMEAPKSIGEVLEDTSLKYDLKKSWAFEELADTEAFEDGEWKTDNGGNSVSYAEGILKSIVGYYEQWQITNQDTSLIGINKLEIGEIRTGENGYYTLCRLTFAGADGKESVKHVTACVKISDNSMLLNDVKEEKL